MTAIKIDSDVPMPSSFRAESGTPKRYPFASMAVGESTLCDGWSAAKTCKAVAAAKAHARRAGKKFEAELDSIHPGKVRIWRTA